MNTAEEKAKAMTLLIVGSLWAGPRAAGEVITTIVEKMKEIDCSCPRSSNDIRYSLRLKIRELASEDLISTTPAPNERLRLTRKCRNLYRQICETGPEKREAA